MTKKLLRLFGPLFALIVVLLVAISSLFEQAKTKSITGSVWFLLFGIFITIRSFTLIFTISHESYIRKWSSIIIHLGVVIGLIGIFLNQHSQKNGYIFLEVSRVGKNLYLNKNFKTIDELPFIIKLDSITYRSTKGFEDAPVAWVEYTVDRQSITTSVTYNHPFDYHGLQFLFSNIIEPGFPHSYELNINNEQYQLLHNQKISLPNKTVLWSFGYDSDENRIGLLINRQEQWLKIGETKQISNLTLTIKAINFAQNQGVIIFVKDLKLRPIIYFGFGLMLLGLMPLVIEKNVL